MENASVRLRVSECPLCITLGHRLASLVAFWTHHVLRLEKIACALRISPLFRERVRVETLVEGAPCSWPARAMLIAPPCVARQKGLPDAPAFFHKHAMMVSYGCMLMPSYVPCREGCTLSLQFQLDTSLQSVSSAYLETYRALHKYAWCMLRSST